MPKILLVPFSPDTVYIAAVKAGRSWFYYINVKKLEQFKTPCEDGMVNSDD